MTMTRLQGLTTAREWARWLAEEKIVTEATGKALLAELAGAIADAEAGR